MPTPHEAIRPPDYPSRYELDATWAAYFGVAVEERKWPSDPPFCTDCGAEMLTLGDLTQEGRPEWHADESLNLPTEGADHAD